MNIRALIALCGISPSAFAQANTGEEVLLRFEAKAQGVEFVVRSGGCTKKAHFGVETLSMKPLTLRLVRLTPDYCEATLTDGQKIEFSYAELGAPGKVAPEDLKNVLIINPVHKP